MSTFLTITTISSSILLFYIVLLCFIHKASARFKKMDHNVGNLEAENIIVFSDYILNNNRKENNPDKTFIKGVAAFKDAGEYEFVCNEVLAY